MGRPHRLHPNQYRGLSPVVLTICTHKRARHFLDADVVEAVSTQFLRTAQREQFEIPGYCFMPDHMHALMTGVSAGADLQRFVRLAKQQTGYQFMRKTGRKLWQDSYFDRTLREDESPAGAIKYLIENPVRAGLVELPEQYPYWGSLRYSRREVLEYVSIECRV